MNGRNSVLRCIEQRDPFAARPLTDKYRKMFKAVVLLAAVAVATAQSDCNGEDITKAIVHLEGRNVSGNIFFTRQDDGKIRVTGKVEGMAPGMYGFHIHEKGDLSQGCLSAKGHFNPDNNDHGHPDDENRHAGDLGNIVFDDSRVANLDFVDRQIALAGRYSIVGRALVLHEKHDDYGKTDHPDSKKTGNAGGRVACGVVGILQSSASTGAVTSLLLATAIISVFI